MDQCRTTFILPYYRGIEYLKITMDSLVEQTEGKWNAIVLDDRGGDDAEDLVASYCDPRFLYVRNEVTLGLAGNWNKGFSLVETEFCAILHTDDALEKNYLEKMLWLLDDFPEVAIGHSGATIMDEDGNKCLSFPDLIKQFLRPSGDVVCTSGETGMISLARGDWIMCPTLFFRTKLLPSKPFSNEWKFVLDLELLTRLLIEGESFVGVKENLYRYRRHKSNQTSILTESSWRFYEELKLMEMLEEKCQKLLWHGATAKFRRRTIVRLHMAYQLVSRVATFKTRGCKQLLTGIYKPESNVFESKN